MILFWTLKTENVFGISCALMKPLADKIMCFGLGQVQKSVLQQACPTARLV